MRIGIIDLGTNSVRFDVQELEAKREPKRLHREKLMVRLGQGVFQDGRLDPGAIRRTIQAFKSFKRTADHLQVRKIVAFATSALREANDRERFLRELRARSGIEVRIISGEEEARLIAQGVLHNETRLKGRFALVDIGGGSTEITICHATSSKSSKKSPQKSLQKSKMLRSASFKLGAARIHQVFLRSNPPKRAKKKDQDPITTARRYIRGTLLSKLVAESWPKTQKIVGSSGTILALNKLINPKGKKKGFTRKELKKLVKELAELTIDELLSLPGMEPKRVDIILAGAILFDEVMEALGAKSVQMTEYALRDGILAEEQMLLKAHVSTPLAFHLHDIRSRAKRFLGSHVSHSETTQAIARLLFDALKKNHALKSEWKVYLEAACLLHDTGEAIHPSKHAEHSWYIARNIDVPGMQEWEAEFIAELCRHHASGKGVEKSPPLFEMASPYSEKQRLEAFLKLLALFRVADALDRNHRSLVKIRSIRVGPRSIAIRIDGKGDADLEILRVEQKKELFEKVFRRTLTVER